MNPWAEDAFFFENDGSKLYGLIHSPERRSEPGGADAPRGVLVCHPFAEEKAVAHRVLTDFARMLCARGYHVMRFDCRGCGDSEGEAADVTIDSQLSDIGCALDEFRRRTGVARPCLLGVRLGATMAALRAAGDEEVGSLILWEPIVHGKLYVDKIIRLQVMANRELGSPEATRGDLVDAMRAQGTAEVVGYEMSAACFDALSSLDLASLIGGFHGEALIMAINKRGRKGRELQTLQQAYEAAGIRTELGSVSEQTFWSDPADPFRELAFWREHDDLFETSHAWLDAQSGVG
jgi:exosortase A-associated hydrolase 2